MDLRAKHTNKGHKCRLLWVVSGNFLIRPFGGGGRGGSHTWFPGDTIGFADVLGRALLTGGEVAGERCFGGLPIGAQVHKGQKQTFAVRRRAVHQSFESSRWPLAVGGPWLKLYSRSSEAYPR